MEPRTSRFPDDSFTLNTRHVLEPTAAAAAARDSKAVTLFVDGVAMARGMARWYLQRLIELQEGEGMLEMLIAACMSPGERTRYGLPNPTFYPDDLILLDSREIAHVEVVTDPLPGKARQRLVFVAEARQVIRAAIAMKPLPEGKGFIPVLRCPYPK